jgi:hypothetical protein
MKYIYNEGVTKRGISKFAILSIAIVYALTMAMSVIMRTSAASTTFGFTQPEIDTEWEADRTFPSDGVTSVTAFGRDYVARIGIDSDETQAGGFYRTEGIKTVDSNDFGDAVEVDLYLDPAWEDTAVRAGLWVVGDDGGVRTENFGVVEFVNSEDCASEADCSTHISNRPDYEGFRIFNGATGDWAEVSSTAFEYGKWVTLGIELVDTEANEYIYFINGEEVGTAPGGGSFIREVFLNSYNYGLDNFPTLISGSYAAHWGGIEIDNTAPIVSINAPSNGSLINGLVDIVGDVSDDTLLSHYNLSLYPGTTDLSDGDTHSSARLNDPNWCTTPISGTVNLSADFSGNLCTGWDTTNYTDGEYQIRLAARDAAGNRDLSDPYNGGTSSIHVITVTIDNTAPATPTGLQRLLASDHSVIYECGAISPIQSFHPDWADNTEDDFAYYEYTSFNAPSGTIGINEQMFNDSIFEYNGPWLPGEGTYGFAVRAVDNAGNKSAWALSDKTLAGSCQITYDNTAPIATVTSHDDGDDVSGTINITGLVTDDNAHHYWFVLQNPSGMTIAGPGVVNDSSSSATPSFSFDTTTVPNGNYTIKLEARDAADNKVPNDSPLLADPENVGDSVDWVVINVNNQVLGDRDDCKRGGWRYDFRWHRIFRNQGHCVSHFTSHNSFHQESHDGYDFRAHFTQKFLKFCRNQQVG